MKRYQIEVSETQLEVMAEALEFYSRFLVGQVEVPMSIRMKLVKMDDQKSKDKNLSQTFLEAAFNSCNFFKSQLFPELEIGASYGMGQKIPHDEHSTKTTALAYDIYRPILELFATIRKLSNVYSHKGIRYSDEPEVAIKCLEIEESDVKIRKKK
jgi:hypothetical protein